MPKPVISLVRAVPEPAVVRIAGEPADVEFDLARTALIVIDMQNDFGHPDGWFGSRGIASDQVRALCPAINGLTAALRGASVPVVWLNWGLDPDLADMPQAILDRGGAFGHAPTYGDPSPSGRGRILVKGEWGAKLLDTLEQDPADIEVHKNRLGGFFHSRLDAVLRKRDVTTLLFAGVNTDRCVFSTLQDAGFLGYDCVLLSDATATCSSTTTRDAVTEVITLLHGVAVSTGDLLPAVSALASRQDSL